MRFLASLLLLFILIGEAVAQTPPPPPPASVLGGSVSLSVTTSSARVALPVSSSTYPSVTLYNDGTQLLYFAYGSNTVVATTSSTPLPPGVSISLWIGAATNVAAITPASTSTLRIYQLNGSASLKSQGSAGTLPSSIPLSNLAQTGATAGQVMGWNGSSWAPSSDPLLLSARVGGATIQQPTPGTFNFNLPATAGTTGQLLASGGGASSPSTWTTLAPVATSGSATDLSAGTLPTGRLPTFIGDLSAGGGTNSITVARINGATLGSTTATSGNLLIGNGTQWATQALSGDVTVNSSGVTAIGATRVTNAMLAGSIAASKLVGSDIATVGTLTTGVWNATPIDLSLYSTGTLPAGRFPALTGDVTTSAGSLATAIGAGKVTNTMLAGSIAASKLIGTDIATLGTVTTGTWNATPVNLSLYAGGTLQAAQEPAHTGDVTNSAGSLATTLAAGSASNLDRGTLPAGRLPALGGDLTSSAGSSSVTVAKVNGVSVSGTPAFGYVPVASSSSAATWRPLSNSIDVYAIGGQSNAQGTGGDATLSPSVWGNGYALAFSGVTLSAANDPVGNASTSSAWPAFTLQYNATTGRRVLLVPSAVGGTDQCATTGISGSNWDLTGTLAATLVTNVNSAMTAVRAAGYVPIYRGILWSQGENDAGAIGAGGVFPASGFGTSTGGPYTAGATAITLTSITGFAAGGVVVITLDNGTTYSSVINSIGGSTLTLATGVPGGRTIPNGSQVFPYSKAMYQTCLRNMLNYFRTTTTDGTTFPQLPFYVSLTGAPQTGDSPGYQAVRVAQNEVAQTDPYTRVVFRNAVDFITRNMMQASSLHYLQEGYNEMGREMAKGVISAIDGWKQTTPNVSRVTLGGTLRNNDQLTITVTSTAINNSPWAIGPSTVTLPGTTFCNFIASVLGNATKFSPNLAAVGITATTTCDGASAVITFSQPGGLSPQAVVTASWITGGATESVSVTTGTSAYGPSPDIYYDRGQVSIGGTLTPQDNFNVFAPTTPTLASMPMGIRSDVSAGNDNNVLRLYNRADASGTFDGRVGLLFQPNFQLGSGYGGFIFSQEDAVTGRGNFIFGGYSGGTPLRNVGMPYDGGQWIGSSCGLSASGQSFGPGSLSLCKNAGTGVDNNVLVLANNNGNVNGQQVGILFNPGTPGGNNPNASRAGGANLYGRTIMALSNDSTGRDHLTFGGYSAGTYAEQVRISEDGGLSLGSTTSPGAGGLRATGIIQQVESSARAYTLKTRTAAIPVPYLRPNTTNSAIAFDVTPNGTATDSGFGVAWIDACDTDIGDAGANATCAHMGARTSVSAIEFGSRTYGSGTVKPLWLTINDGTPWAVIDTSGNFLLGGATAQSANLFQVELNHSTNSGQVIGALNPNAGASAYAAFGTKAQTANGFILSYSDAAAGARYGITLAGYTELLSNAGNGLLIGTAAAGTPIVLGNSVGAERMRVSSTGGINIGASVMTLTAGEVGLNKIAASGSAPGAAGGKLALVCGTNPGTAKIIAYAGTSTTPVTVVDNIGGSVTGC